MEKIKVNKNGQEIEMELMLKFETEEDNKKYAVYTDNSLTPEGKTNLYAYYYTTDENDLKPVPVEEMSIVEEALKNLKENYSTNE